MIKCDYILFALIVLWVQEEAYWIEVVSLSEEVWFGAEANKLQVLYELS